MSKEVVIPILQAGNTAAELATLNPVGFERQLVFETDTLKAKLLDGVNHYNDLPYVISPSGGAVWGGITGTLANQTDLQSALNAKQATLVSGTNIKTINGSSVLGSGDLVIGAGMAIGDAVTGATPYSVLFTDVLGNLDDDPNFYYSSTTGTLVVPTRVIVPNIRANGSGGLLLENNNGTDVALFGAGNGSNATFYGGVNIAGDLAVDTNVLYVDTTNNRVGIGTSGPDRKLDILDTSAAQLRLTYTDGSVYTDFQTDSGGVLIITPSGNDVTITAKNVLINDSNAPALKFSADTYIGTSGSTDQRITYNARGGDNTGSWHNFTSSVNLTATSGNQNFLGSTHTFAPNSGTATFSSLNLSPTINQTGGANGITRGLYINPTLTSAADFRAIDVVAGKTVLGGDLVVDTNVLYVDATNNRVGINNSSPTYALDVVGILQTTGPILGGGDFTLYNTNTGVQVPGNGYYRFGNQIGINSSADGVLRITDWAGTSFNRLQFGGTSSSYPALKRSSAALQVRLADDSAFANLQCEKLLNKVHVEAKTNGSGSPYAVSADESGTHFTNKGAHAETYFNLPSAAAGLRYTFTTNASQRIRVVAAAGDYIKSDTTVSSSGGYVRSLTATPNISITLECIDSATWQVVAITITGGAITWTFA